MLHVASICRGLVPVANHPARAKKYYPGWRDPFSLTDYDNLSKRYPTVTEQWEAEWSLTKIVPPELKAFDINRLPYHLLARNRRVFIPIKYDYERRPAYQRKLFGIYGLSSGVNPCELFDSYEDLAREEELRKLLEPDLEEFKRKQNEEKAECAKREEERIRKITENLARLPEILEKYRLNQEKKKESAKVQEANKRQLLEEARDRFGYYVDPRDPKFLKLIEEKQEKKKLEKRAAREK